MRVEGWGRGAWGLEFEFGVWDLEFKVWSSVQSVGRRIEGFAFWEQTSWASKSKTGLRAGSETLLVSSLRVLWQNIFKEVLSTKNATQFDWDASR